MFDNIVDRVFLDQRAAHRRESLADAGKEKTQIVVNLGLCANRAARIAHDDLLLNGYGRRNAEDKVTFWLAHSSEELTRIARQRLDITALTLGIQSVESQRALARARQSCYYHELASRYLYVNVLEVVDPRSLDNDIARIRSLWHSFQCFQLSNINTLTS